MRKLLFIIIIVELIAVINPIRFISVKAQDHNLVINGGFEDPIVTHPGKWDVFTSSEIPGWTVEWFRDNPGAPEDALLEFHRGFSDWDSFEGEQHVELDSQWEGPDDVPTDNSASVSLYQDIPTVSGTSYTITYAWAPRPNHADNGLWIYWGADTLNRHFNYTGSPLEWRYVQKTMIAQSSVTRLTFEEVGAGDSLGMFIDDVVVTTEDIQPVIRSGEISSPLEGATIVGDVSLDANLTDDDYDDVEWAIRKGGCEDDREILWGNVDSRNDPYTWVYKQTVHTFHSEINTCLWKFGLYCFVFDPIEDDGEEDIRLTRMFAVDYCDNDGDDIPDVDDNCPLDFNPDQEDADNDGMGDACDPDDDNDGIDDTDDNCQYIPNPEQEDTDNDGKGDVCDSDDDNDGIEDPSDNCRLIPNPDQEDNDHDGMGDVCDSDDDNDQVEDDVDNCHFTPNPDQEDVDGDGIGDACDLDNDNDGIDDADDNCPFTYNPDQKDFDGDGLGDACDSDDDNDGVGDADDMCKETTADVPKKTLGTNRWIWNGSKWITKRSKGKGPKKNFTMQQTKGCSCFDILSKRSGSFGGHYKFGCSSGILTSWIKKL